MSLESWELSYCPSDKDNNRWRLKMKISDDKLSELVSSLPGTVSRPFAFEDEQYNYGVYLYDVKNELLEQIRTFIENECPVGTIINPETKGSLDDLLDRVAEGFDSAIKIYHDDVKKDKNESEDHNSEDVSSTGTESNEKESISISMSVSDLELNNRYTFQEFVIGPNNRFTAAAAQAVADNPGKIYNPFFIYSGVGLGKTHLMHAVGHYVHGKKPSTKILYVSTEKFMGDVIDAIRKGTLLQMREHYRQADLLLIDDIQFLVESESTQEEFFHTFNVLHQSSRQIIITSDRPPKQLNSLEDRLRSRFEWGLIADIKPPNLETRIAILKKKGENENLNLADNILLYIATKLKSNIRELEGFLKRIHAYASLTHQDVNMDLVRSLMDDLLPAEEQDEPEHPPVQTHTDLSSAKQEIIIAQPEISPVVDVPLTADVPIESVSDLPQTLNEQLSQPQEIQLPEMESQTLLLSESVNPQESSESVNPPQVLEPSGPPVPIEPSKPEQQPIPPPPNEQSENGIKALVVAFFYPEEKEQELSKVKDHFHEIIKKHKLKFRLEGAFEKPYSFSGKINYTFFTELCKNSNVNIAVVLGVPPDSPVVSDDFANLLTSVMDDEKISLQFVPWAELNKDYRYLNLALDITLLKSRT